MNRERLEHFSREAIPFIREKEAQELLVWDYFYAILDQDGDFVEAEEPCGSYACALGWLSRIESYRKDGWGVSYSLGTPVWTTPDGAVYDGFAAAAKYFGISSFSAERIFGASEQGTLDDRIQFIEELLNGEVDDTY